MPRKRSKPRLRAIIISLLVSAAALIIGYYTVEGIDLHSLLKRLFWPLLRLLIFIGIGLVIGQIIEATGWTRYIAVAAMPVFRFGHLGHHCSAVFTTAFFSGVTANAMLMEFYREGAISRKQLFLSNLLNQFPAYFLHLPTTFFIVIPLTGRAGVLYFILTFSAALIRSIVLLIYGHLRLDNPGDVGQELNDKSIGSPRRKLSQIWDGISQRLPVRLTNIAIYVIPIYIAVYMLNAIGLFETLRSGLARFTSVSVLPLESLSLVIISFAAEFTSGFAAAGALMQAGVLTMKQTVLALLIGNIVAFPIRAIRHQLPHYMGIYEPKTGLQLLLLGQSVRVTSLILVGFVYYTLF
jgi:hypothetical protein